MRRGVNMTYILENNGVYGLTKGQFSATADKGIESEARRGQHRLAGRHREPRAADGRHVRRRSFSGDKHQLVPLVKAAIAHQGAAFIDVISPCVAFNNHAGSTKSYDYVREHNEA
jgi:2-oxoglutarate ferredoxin oxidoreductase subunit beta